MRNIHKRFRYLIQIFIVIGVIFSYTNCQSVSAATLGDSSSASLGSYVTFGGKTWRVIGDNYLMLDQSDSSKAYGSALFDPYASSNVAYYLNNTFYSALGADASYVQSWNWTTGNQTNESATSINCKVGLVSYSEWGNIATYMENKSTGIWTRTQSTTVTCMWYINTSEVLTNLGYSSSSGVFPAIHLTAGMDISSGTGTSGDPYILAAAPAGEMPTLSVTSPIQNQAYSVAQNVIALAGQTKGANVGDILKVYYRIDGNAGTAGTQVGTDITASGANQNYSGNINISAVTQGRHILNIWVEENNGRKTADISIYFTMSTNLQLSDHGVAALGSYVTFGGKTWRVIGDNYLMLDQSDSSKAYGSALFDPYASNNLAYYINNTFYNALGADTSYIQSWNWTIGDQTNESASSINCNVGLVSYSEWGNIATYMENKSTGIWTRTQSTTATCMWYINTNKVLTSQGYSSSSGVFPAIHLIAGMNISSGTGTSGDPYILVAAPAGEMPTLSVTSPIQNQAYSVAQNVIALAGQTKGANIGDILKVYYRIDGNAGTAGTQVGTDITASGANQNYSTNIDISAVTQGRHILNIWVEENNGRKTADISIYFTMSSNIQLADHNTAALGSYVTFGGKTWRVIGDNYLMLDQSDSSKVYGNSAVFDPSTASNLAYYINNTFYNILGADTSYIQNWSWTIGDQTNESASSINCNVGLVSYSEWNNIGAYMENKSTGIWTRTKYTIATQMCYINTSKGLTYQGYPSSSGVYPTIHLTSGLGIISGTGTSSNPYILGIATNVPPSTSIVSDVANNGDGRDIQVAFTASADETYIAGYRIFVVKATDAPSFDQATASALASSRYVSEAKTTGGATHTLTLTQALLDSSGAAIVNGTAYKVFVLGVGQGANDVLSTGSNSLTLGLTMQGITTMSDAVKDLYNYGDGRDIRVMFKGAPNENNISGYRVIVVRSAVAGTFDEGTASGLSSTSYAVDPVKGRLKIHLVYLTQSLQNSEGAAITGGVPYTVYVLTLGKNGYTNVLTSVGSVTLDTNNEGHRVAAPKPTVIDVANNGNGIDIKVTFRRSKSEVNVQEYRIIVSTTTLTLAQAESVPAAGYKSITVTGPKISYAVTLGATQKIQDGVTAIQNGTAYRVYILAIGKNGYANVLSTPSRIITLSQYVPGVSSVRSLKVLKVGTGHNSSNIKVSFYEPIAVNNVQEYRIFIVPAANTLNQTTAEGIVDTALYQTVATTGKEILHSVTLDAGKKDYANGALAAGDYKVYVLTAGKSGYSNKLSVVSGNVTLN